MVLAVYKKDFTFKHLDNGLHPGAGWKYADRVLGLELFGKKIV
jgi:hypothetical protein